MLVGTLYREADTSSKIPVALVDDDVTDMSRNIVDNLKDDKTLKVIEYTKEDALADLKDGKLEVVYILKRGLEDNIIKEEYHEIIDVYYLKGSTIARFIGDIFAEKVLRDLCLTKSINMLNRALDSNNYDSKDDILADAYNYGVSMQQYDTNRQYYIKVSYVDNEKNNIKVSGIDNSIIYKKMIIGIIISFTAFFLLFASISIVKDKETGMLYKIQVTSTNNATLIVGNYLSLVVSGVVISLIFSIINGIYANKDNSTIFISTFIALVMYVISVAALIMLFTSFVDTVATHTMVFTIFILIMGIVSGSFFSIDLLSSNARYISYIIPNYWTLNYILDIITIGFRSKQLFEYIFIMLLYTVIMISVTYIINKYRKKEI
ncbi:permease [Vallitalea longa]|uniref:Permease n=2 Tax=Vallitalea longa TaxID=2936439 RepID=A0A9W5Y968_9FIRM|nr:permease [Vallitalea longa]